MTRCPLIVFIAEKDGLSPMKRTHIHLAQHYSHIKGAKAPPGPYKAIPSELFSTFNILFRTGLRNNSQVLIHIDLDRALQARIPFFQSANGVVLSKGDESGYLRPEFFKLVTDARGKPLPGWTSMNLTQSNEREAVREDVESDETRSSNSVSDGGHSGTGGGKGSLLQTEAQPTIEETAVEASTVTDRLSQLEVKGS